SSKSENAMLPMVNSVRFLLRKAFLRTNLARVISVLRENQAGVQNRISGGIQDRPCGSVQQLMFRMSEPGTTGKCGSSDEASDICHPGTAKPYVYGYGANFAAVPYKFRFQQRSH